MSLDGSILPRSVRWRIQMGLLEVPPASLDCQNVHTILKILWQHNQALVQEQQRKSYRELMEMHYTPFLQQVQQQELLEQEHDQQQQQQDDEGEEEANMLDPLTAMLMETQAKEKRRQEIDLKYRKERARRKRGIASSNSNDDGGQQVEDDDTDEHYVQCQTRAVIQKDLDRLQPEHYSHFLARFSSKHPKRNDVYNECVAERNLWLEQILFVHAQVCPQLGYRQGMHEIASYLLFVLEMDLHQYHDFGLLDEACLVEDAYQMFATLMKELSGAYDVVNNSSSNSKQTPMELVGKSILLRIRHVAQDEKLYSLLERTVPPQLYCTKWIRLMFSREVTGWRNVLLLWDELFDVTFRRVLSKQQRQAHNNNNTLDLQTVLELTAACRIMLIRSDLLMHSSNINDCIHLLMNTEPLESIAPVVEVLDKMAERLLDPSGTERTPLILQSEEQPMSSNSHAPRVNVAAKTMPSSSDGGGGALSSSLNRIRDVLLEQQPQHLGDAFWKGASKIIPDIDPNQKAASTGEKSVDPLMGSVPPVRQPQHPRHSPQAAKGAPMMQQEQQHSPSLFGTQHDGNEVSLAEMFSSSLKRLTSTPTATTRSNAAAQVRANNSSSHATVKHQEQHFSNRDLANKLHGCVLTIQQYLMKTTAASPITPKTHQTPTPKQQQDVVVPESVWEALAEIETVRMHLLQHE